MKLSPLVTAQQNFFNAGVTVLRKTPRKFLQCGSLCFRKTPAKLLQCGSLCFRETPAKLLQCVSLCFRKTPAKLLQCGSTFLKQSDLEDFFYPKQPPILLWSLYKQDKDLIFKAHTKTSGTCWTASWASSWIHAWVEPLFLWAESLFHGKLSSLELDL